MNTQTRAAITATQVPDGEQKLEVLPRHFGGCMMDVESTVYDFMRRLVPTYRGGLWHFYELSNGGFYMALDQVESVQVHAEMNGYEGDMSADAAGITACLYTFSHLSFETKNDVLIRHYYLLRDFAMEHAERRKIFAAID